LREATWSTAAGEPLQTSRRRPRSFADGLAVAYGFLHLLPEVAEGSKALADPLIDLGTFWRIPWWLERASAW
jgi:hypothetical protein